MSGTIYMAASGAILAQNRLDVIANNLANIDSVGFKKSDGVFRMADYQNQGNATTRLTGYGRPLPATLPFEILTDYSQGRLKQTDNPLDLAIKGDGFFCIGGLETESYTRKGNFTLDPEGILITQDGMPVLGDRGLVVVDGTDVYVDGEGNVLVDGEITDRLRIVDVDQPGDLKKVGNSLFALTNPDVPPTEADNYEVIQGNLEMSNVEPVKMMTEMIETHRMFEAYQKIIRSVDDATGRMIEQAGRLA